MLVDKRKVIFGGLLFFLVFNTVSVWAEVSSPILNGPIDGVMISTILPQTFQWGPVTDATGYAIEFSKDPNFTNIIKQESIPADSILYECSPLGAGQEFAAGSLGLTSTPLVDDPSASTGKAKYASSPFGTVIAKRIRGSQTPALVGEWDWYVVARSTTGIKIKPKMYDYATGQSYFQSEFNVDSGEHKEYYIGRVSIPSNSDGVEFYLSSGTGEGAGKDIYVDKFILRPSSSSKYYWRLAAYDELNNPSYSETRSYIIIARNGHYVEEWLALGAFPGSSLDPVETRPFEGDVVEDNQWVRISCDNQGILSIPGELGFGYAHLYVNSPENKVLKLRIGNNITLYRNGARLYALNGSGSLTPDNDNLMDITLFKGWNMLLVETEKSENNPGNFFIGFYNLDGTFPADIDIALNDPLTIRLQNPTIDNTIFSPNGTKNEVNVSFTASVSCKVTARIVRVSNNEVVCNLIENKSFNTGPIIITWNGKEADGNIFEDGLYRIEIDAASVFDDSSAYLNYDVTLQASSSISSPILSWPINGVMLSTILTQEFQWEPVIDATGYEIEFSKDSNFISIIKSESIPADRTSFEGSPFGAGQEFAAESLGLSGTPLVDDLLASTGKAKYTSSPFNSQIAKRIRGSQTPALVGEWDWYVVARSTTGIKIKPKMYDYATGQSYLPSEFNVDSGEYKEYYIGRVSIPSHSDGIEFYLSSGTGEEAGRDIYVDKFILRPSASKCYWRVAAYDELGVANYSEAFEILITGPIMQSAVDNLYVYPNPFVQQRDEELYISFSNGEDAIVSLYIYNLEGQLVRSLIKDAIYLDGEDQKIKWDGRDDNRRLAPSGLYLVVIKSKDSLESKSTTKRIPLVFIR